MESEPAPILRFDDKNNKYEFNEKEFEKIITNPEIQEYPIAVVSIVGDYRTGKSLFLNYLLRYLKNYDNTWSNLNEPLKGFSWKHGLDRNTIGIVLWPEPLIITKKNGTKIAFILMDTPGLFDDQTKHEHCSHIFAISSILSSVQIFNKMHNLQRNDVQNLTQFTEYAKKKKEMSGFKAFQKILLLIRDSPATCNFPYGSEGGRQFLKYKRANQKNHFEKEWNALDECYSEIDCFLMPHPGLVVNEPDFDGSLNKMTPEFHKCLNEIFDKLLSPENIVIKMNQGIPMKISDFGNYFLTIVEKLNENSSINNDDLLDIDYDNQARNVSIAAFAEFLKKYIEFNPKNDPKKIILCAEKAQALAILLFIEKTKFIDSEIAENHLLDWKSTVSEYINENLIKENANENKNGKTGLSSRFFFTVGNFLLSFGGPIVRTVGPIVLDYSLQIFLDRMNSKSKSNSNSQRRKRK